MMNLRRIPVRLAATLLAASIGLAASLLIAFWHIQLHEQQVDRLASSWHMHYVTLYLTVVSICACFGYFIGNFYRKALQLRSALTQERAHFQQIFQDAPFPLLLINNELVVESINHAAQRLSNTPEADSLGKRVGDVIRCLNAEDHACGTGQPCQTCPLRSRILEALENQDRKKPILIRKAVQRDGKQDILDLQISATHFDCEGEPHALLALVDISHHEQYKREAEEIRELLEVVREIHRNLIHEKNRQALLRNISDILVTRLKPCSYTWMALYDDNGQLSCYHETLGDQFPGVDALRQTLQKRGELGCQRRADEGHFINMASDKCAHCPLHDMPDQVTFCVPLVYQAQHYGYMALSLEKDFAQRGLCEGTLREISDDIAHALHAIESMETVERLYMESDAARKKAEQADLAKDQFLQVMSHELRTPLNPVIGFTELLMERMEDPADKELLSLIYQGGMRELEIIDRILFYTRLGHHDLKTQAASTCIWDLCKRLIRESEPIKTGCDLHLINGTTHASSINETRAFVIDGQLVYKLLKELLDNALQFTEKGQINLRVGQTKNPDGQLLIHFEVEDDGPGISQDYLERVYEPFLQSDYTNTRAHGGLGIGLATVKKLVLLLNGEIQIDSQLDMGSCVRVTLPAAIPSTNRGRKAGAQQKEMPNLAGARVLIVEDNADNAQYLKIMLERMGVITTLANHGRNAQELANEQPLDLILMDIAMPILDGIEATRLIREQSTKNVQTPIVALSATLSQELREQCLNAGMQAFMSKPVRRADITRILRIALATAKDETTRLSVWKLPDNAPESD